MDTDSRKPTDPYPAPETPAASAESATTSAPEATQTPRNWTTSYKWRIFIPTVVMVWLMMGAILIYQYNREVNYRTESVSAQLNLINTYLKEAYERKQDLHRILLFVDQYLDNSVIYENVRVSLYTKDGALIDYIGSPIPTVFNGRDPATELLGDSETQMDIREEVRQRNNLMFYKPDVTDDGEMFMRTALPNEVTLTDTIRSTKGMWLFIVILGVVCTVMIYLAVRMLSRNIVLLHNFASNAAAGREIDQTYAFPHDELGDISRQIISLYRSRTEAIAQVEREHDVALHAIEEKSRIKNQLTNNINHELKTPIGIIKGYIDTILTDRDKMPDETKYKFLERAQANVDRLCALLNDVSTMTRLEEGGEKIPVGEVDFHDLVYQLNSDFRAAYSQSGMTFSFDVPLGCKVKGNANVLTSLITNLMRNAMMHSHGTAMELRQVGESKDYYTFSFADNGIGVPRESLPHLFERFYRVDTGRSRKAGGSGLGLPIVRNVVVVLGGAISVKNRSTGGLEFTFTLPRWKSDSREG